MSRFACLTVCSACISSVCRLVYSVKNLLTLDKLYAFQEFGMWGCVSKHHPATLLLLRFMLTSTPSIAEVTTLILCGCLPVLPRLRQVFQHNTSHSPSNERSFKMNITQSNKSKSNPSNPSQSSTTTWIGSAYVPLSELSAATISSRGADEDAVEHGGIKKTVHIETQLQDNIC